MSIAGTAELGEGAEVADGKEAVGAPAVVLQLDVLYGSPYFITKSPLMLPPPEPDPSCIGGDRLSNLQVLETEPLHRPHRLFPCI